MEGFEVAIAALVERMSICEFYSSIYNGVPLPSLSAASSRQLQGMLDSALPELYAAVIVFSVKAHTYFKAKGAYGIHCILQRVPTNYTEPNPGIQKLAKPLKSFDLEFQPFIEEINEKERVIRECADAATMARVRSKYSKLLHQWI